MLQAETEEVGLMQQALRPWRPDLWRSLLLRFRNIPLESVVVARRLRRWVVELLDGMAPLGNTVSEEDRRQGLRIGGSMVEMLNPALSEGSLVRAIERDRSGPAVRDVSRDVAMRSNRTQRDEQVSLDHSWSNFFEEEELRVQETRRVGDPQMLQDGGRVKGLREMTAMIIGRGGELPPTADIVFGNKCSELLGTVMGSDAWPCLLDMRSPLEPTEEWGWGLLRPGRTLRVLMGA